jgi:hypothetical protein
VEGNKGSLGSPSGPLYMVTVVVWKMYDVLIDGSLPISVVKVTVVVVGGFGPMKGIILM